MTIATVIRLKNDAVLVFDGWGEQLPEYQGKYRQVKRRIREDAPPEAVFMHWFERNQVPRIISREDW